MKHLIIIALLVSAPVLTFAQITTASADQAPLTAKKKAPEPIRHKPAFSMQFSAGSTILRDTVFTVPAGRNALVSFSTGMRIGNPQEWRVVPFVNLDFYRYEVKVTQTSEYDPKSLKMTNFQLAAGMQAPFFQQNGSMVYGTLAGTFGELNATNLAGYHKYLGLQLGIGFESRMNGIAFFGEAGFENNVALEKYRLATIPVNLNCFRVKIGLRI